jgi:hypothetical protein
LFGSADLTGAFFVPKKKTTSHGSSWTKEDVKALKAHSKARTPVVQIAKAMKRTEGALRRKAGILGIGLGHDR